MSNVGVHSFQIPHEHVQPTRDMVIIRLPMPPSKIGNILTADITRDMMQHNVMAGRVFAMGPLAFTYKDGEGGISKQRVNIGDWVLFRPFAGTMIQGGKLVASSGWRYISSFNDVIGIIPAEHMPNPETLEWDYEPNQSQQVSDFNFHGLKEIRRSSGDY
jgi:co-chaperonin GroES (HSP10)